MRRLLTMLWLLSTPIVAAAHPGGPDDPRHTPVVTAVERATPAVVTVQVEVATASPFFAFRAERRASEGSGVIIAPDGVVLTNAHVVDGAADIRVHLHDGRDFEADLVALDAALDLAVLRLRDASGLPTLPLGDSDDLHLGETVVAIGNPFGLGLTVSTGVVASTGRDVHVGDGPTQTYIQTDAAINPGNSGGALVDLNGSLIGINTFIQRGAEGIGFAIPVQRARKVAGDLLTFGAVQIPWVGAHLVDVPPGRLPAPWQQGAPAVLSAPEGTPAFSAGLRRDDVLLEIDGHRVASRSDLQARLAERTPGEALVLTVLRGASTLTVKVPSRRAPGSLGKAALAALGIAAEPVRGGLRIARADADGTWAAAGLREGDVVLGVDGRRVSSPDELAIVLQRAAASHRATVWVAVARGYARGTREVRLVR